MIASNLRPLVLGSVLTFAASASGCADPLKEVELIEALRVLGARVEVEGEPERAAPRPGENARVRWLVAAPELEPALSWSFVACVAKPSNLGVASCAEPPFASGETREPALGEPWLDLGVPAGLDPEATPRIAVLGSICPDASVSGSGEQASCSRNGGTRVSLEFELARAEDVNQNPSFGEEPLRFAGAPWPATAGSPTTACAGTGLLEIAAGSGDHDLELELAPDARDPLPVRENFDPEREELRLAHFSTDGGLERPFSALAADEPETTIGVSWRAPKSAAAEGELVRFWFVVRDLRGGSDFALRSLCVVP